MKHYTKKNKKSKLAKGFLCLLLALSPMMMNVSKAQAVERNMGNYILDLEEGRLWYEDENASNARKARESTVINRFIDYEKHEITWEIIYNANRERWTVFKPMIGVVLPKTDLSKTRIVRIREGEAGVTTWDPVDDFPWEYLTGRSHKWGGSNKSAYPDVADGNHQKFLDDYEYYVRKPMANTQSGSDLNTWRDTGRLGRTLFSAEDPTRKQIILRITTYHDEDTALENVPLVAAFSNWAKKFLRVTVVGPFGIASWHELKVPKRVYVDDVDHLTESDKKRIFGVIKEDTDKWLKTLDNPEKAEREENEARQEIVDNNMYVKTFSDGSKLKLGLRSFVRQRELKVLNQENVVNWKDSVDIALGVNDPEFKNEMIAMPAEGELPAGLGWDKTAITTDVPNGKIRGIPNIDWSKVEGEPGKKQVTFKFNLALRKEDKTINKRPETYKPITITVRQDEGAVPVGVEDFPTTPFVLLSMISFSTIMIIFLRRRAQEE